MRPPVQRATAHMVEKYASRPIQPLSINDIIKSAQPTSFDSLLKSACWIQQEIPVRLAHRLHDFNRLPYIVVSNPQVSKVYELYNKAFEEICGFGPINDEQSLDKFTNMLKQNVMEHVEVIRLMQQGVSELKVTHQDIVLDNFLDRLFVTRLGNRVLNEHHLALHSDFKTPSPDSAYVGIVHQRCRPAAMVQSIADRVAQVAMYTYGCAPEVCLEGELETEFCYIPEHIRFVVFEMLKNSIRATIEKHRDAVVMPKVTVGVHKGRYDVIIKISDKGGGMEPEVYKQTFRYGFTTVKAEGGSTEGSSAASSAAGGISGAAGPNSGGAFGVPSGGGAFDRREMAGYGFGLPLSRLYTRYFGGDLNVQTMAGFGTDTYIHFARLGDQREDEYLLNNHMHTFKQSLANSQLSHSMGRSSHGSSSGGGGDGSTGHHSHGPSHGHGHTTHAHPHHSSLSGGSSGAGMHLPSSTRHNTTASDEHHGRASHHRSGSGYGHHPNVGLGHGVLGLFGLNGGVDALAFAQVHGFMGNNM